MRSIAPAERAGEHEAHGDGLAVQQLVATDRLERVRERVAEVERRPEPGALVRVDAHDVCLHRRARGDEVGEHVHVTRDHRGGVLLDDGADALATGHERVLRHLAETGPVLARRAALPAW